MANIEITATYTSGRKEIHYAKGPKTLESKVNQLKKMPTVEDVKWKILDSSRQG